MRPARERLQRRVEHAIGRGSLSRRAHRHAQVRQRVSRLGARRDQARLDPVNFAAPENQRFSRRWRMHDDHPWPQGLKVCLPRRFAWWLGSPYVGGGHSCSDFSQQTGPRSFNALRLQHQHLISLVHHALQRVEHRFDGLGRRQQDSGQPPVLAEGFRGVVIGRDEALVGQGGPCGRGVGGLGHNSNGLRSVEHHPCKSRHMLNGRAKPAWVGRP